MTGRWRTVLAAAGVLALIASGCGDDDDEGAADTTTSAPPAELQEVTVTASESEKDDGTKSYSFDVPDDLTAGPIQLNLENTGAETHHAQLYKMNDGTAVDQVGGALAEEDFPTILSLGAFTGGTGVTAPGGSESPADALAVLEEGQYLMLCFLPDANNVPHLANGMMQEFSVGPAVEPVAELPEADLTVDALDFGFNTDELPASGVVELKNTSATQLHELQIFQLGDGATVDDVTGFFLGEAPAGPPPFIPSGGVQALMPGASQRFAADLDAGSYVIMCLIPDPADNKPHFTKGMVTTVRVT